MQRKLIQHGPHSLGISLPSSWLKERGLEKGDALEVFAGREGLTVTENKRTLPQEVTLDITDYNTAYLTKRITQLYEDGAQKIIFTYKKQEILRSADGGVANIQENLKYYVSRLLGFEITELSTNRAEIEYLFSGSLMTFAQAKSKVLVIIRHAMDNLTAALKNNDRAALKRGQELHDSAMKFIHFAKRDIHLSHRNKSDYLLLVFLDKLVDYIRHAHHNALAHTEFSQETCTAIEKIHAAYLLFDEGMRTKKTDLLKEALYLRAQTYNYLLSNELPSFIYMYSGVLEVLILLVENATRNVSDTP